MISVKGENLVRNNWSINRVLDDLKCTNGLIKLGFWRTTRNPGVLEERGARRSSNSEILQIGEASRSRLDSASDLSSNLYDSGKACGAGTGGIDFSGFDFLENLVDQS